MENIVLRSALHSVGSVGDINENSYDSDSDNEVKLADTAFQLSNASKSSKILREICFKKRRESQNIS